MALIPRPLAAVLALSTAACTLPSDGRHYSKETFEKTVPLSPNGTFHLENVNGDLRVEAWDKNEVEIVAKKSGDVSEIKIDVTAEPDEVKVRTKFPHHTFVLFRRNTKVDYTVHVPALARLDLDTVNGLVDVDDSAGRLHIDTVNAVINVRHARGEVRASSVNGAINVACSHVVSDGTYEFDTTNGKIHLTLPPNVSGDFRGSTVNGWIETDFPLSVSGKFLMHDLSGHLGDGGPTFKLSAVNGLLSIRKASEENASR
jgi:DUF4097 and DUF4098 domain-containing protein YvlB